MAWEQPFAFTPVTRHPHTVMHKVTVFTFLIKPVDELSRDAPQQLYTKEIALCLRSGPQYLRSSTMHHAMHM